MSSDFQGKDSRKLGELISSIQQLTKMTPLMIVLIGVLAVLSSVYCQDQVTYSRPKRTCPGATAKVGDTVSVHYEGFIDKSSATGQPDKMFDSSLKRGQPFSFRLGAGEVIAGWDQGILGMCLGDKNDLTIPPSLGYGSRGAGNDIPGGATLRFSVDLVGINDDSLKVEQAPNVFAEMDTNRDLMVTREEMAHWFATMHPDKLEVIPDGLFEREDKNGDGVISWDEFDGPKGHGDHAEL